MKMRTLLIAALLVGAFVVYSNRSGWPSETKPSDVTWTAPTVAHSAGLSADEINSIDIYKAADPSVVYITSSRATLSNCNGPC